MTKGTVRQNELETGRAVLHPRRMTKHSPFRYFKTSPEIIRLAVRLFCLVTASLFTHQLQAEPRCRSRWVASIIERIDFDCPY